MTYRRVIPRDLFNEANLLKCYGQLILKLDDVILRRPAGSGPRFRLEHDSGPFEVFQDESDGSITLWPSVEFSIDGKHIGLRRPLNSREPWPLYATNHGSDEVAVFDDRGELTLEFKSWLGA